MTTREAFRAAAAVIVRKGDLATYLPVVGDPVSLYVLENLDMQFQPRGNEAQVTGQLGSTLMYAKADLEAYPQRGAVFQSDAWDTDYEVQSVSEDDGYFVTLVVKEAS